MKFFIGTGHKRLSGVFILLSAFLFSSPSAQAQSGQASSEESASAKALTTTQEAELPRSRRLFVGPAENELYSENLFDAGAASLATQTRLRHQRRLLSEKLRGFLGVVIDRNIAGSERLIENTFSPAAGLIYQPLPSTSLWAEYRLRLSEAQASTPASTVNDPRFGLSFAESWSANVESLKAEIYAEALILPRVTTTPVASGWARGLYRAHSFGLSAASSHFDLYSELNGFASPHKDLGETRQQLRAGLRWLVQGSRWSSSLLIYNPWKFSTETFVSTGPEALLILAGTF